MMRRDNQPFDRDREFAVILENLSAKFDTFADGLGAVRNRLEMLYAEFGRQKEKIFLIKADIAVIKKDISEMKSILKGHDKRLSRLGLALN